MTYPTAAALRAAYAPDHPTCAACGVGGRLQLAHIQGGHGFRKHVTANVLMLCMDCHHGHGSIPALSKATCVALKDILGELDVAALAAIRCEEGWWLDKLAKGYAELAKEAMR